MAVKTPLQNVESCNQLRLPRTLTDRLTQNKELCHTKITSVAPVMHSPGHSSPAGPRLQQFAARNDQGRAGRCRSRMLMARGGVMY